MPTFERSDELPYLLELRNVLDAALYRFDELESAAARWLAVGVKIDRPARIAGEPGRAGLLGQMAREQSSIFDAIEAFLALYARVSLLLFPVGGTDPLAAWRRSRGEVLRQRLELTSSSLAHRDVRDAWMHFDERLDAAVSRGEGVGPQLFKLAVEVTNQMREHALRLVEVDRLALSFRDREGRVQVSELRTLRDELVALEGQLTKALSGGVV
jgi:hypothetical protein